MEIVLYTLASVLIVSLISLIGILTLGMKEQLLKRIVLYLVGFSTGALFGDVFFHILPEIAEDSGWTIEVSLAVLAGILFSFAVEKLIHWHHCHDPSAHGHVHSFALMSLVGDAVHNFIDGIIIAASYFVSIPVGIATTLAVVLHEIPQEIGNFGVLVHGGYSKTKALMLNFVTALTAVLGAVLALVLGEMTEQFSHYLLPFAAGGFIYIAGSDLIPELHKETSLKKSILQLLIIALGMGVMASLLLLEVH
jgi:zinc and cadmium transporter